jgi:hypothetical protein
VVFAYHFLRDLLCENMRANMLNENLYQNLTTQKNDTTISHKYTAMHRLPSASIVPRGFPEGRSCGTLGVDGRRCMGAVRRPSLSLRLAQHPPGVLRRTLGRVSADTANSMMNEGDTCAIHMRCALVRVPSAQPLRPLLCKNPLGVIPSGNGA